MPKDLVKAERKRQLKIAAEQIYEAHKLMESAIGKIPTSEVRNSATDVNLLLITLYGEISKMTRNFYLEKSNDG